MKICKFSVTNDQDQVPDQDHLQSPQEFRTNSKILFQSFMNPMKADPSKANPNLTTKIPLPHQHLSKSVYGCQGRSRFILSNVKFAANNYSRTKCDKPTLSTIQEVFISILFKGQSKALSNICFKMIVEGCSKALSTSNS